MFIIGNIPIPNRIVAAPLAGVSDKAFRILARSFGCGLVFSEMISSKGLVYQQEKTLKLADLSYEDSPVAVQIFGAEIEPMARAARIVEELGASMVDINMGCPTPKITKNGEGAALMRDVGFCRELIRAVVDAVKVPVTVKMRKGWDEDSITCLELAKVAEQEGVQAITIHPRTRNQFFSGRADWDTIRAVKQQVSIPVIGNGDVNTALDAVRMIAYTGCDAVMIGRAALGNPFIFREALELLDRGESIPPPSSSERIMTAVIHLDLVCKFKGEEVAVREMRKHFSWYMRGLKGASKLRQQINQCRTRDELIDAISLLQGI